MSGNELSLTIKTLKSLNLNTEEESSSVALGDLFDSCLKAHKQIEDTILSSNDKLLQEAVTLCVKSLEKCTTMVNDLELFSSNETIDEIQTSSIKYLILPVLLGVLSLSRQTKDLSERLNYVNISDVYLRDFLLRCKNYELCEKTLIYFNDETCDDKEDKSSQTDPNALRQRKIHLYKLKKELEEKEKILKVALERPESEEFVREYYMALLERWILVAIEELENVKREKGILRNIPNKDLKNGSQQSAKEVVPLKPFIITKNEIQKKVFGLGYPSIPVMTIEDWYYHRFHDQIQDQKAQNTGVSLQDRALKGEDMSNNDAEEIEKEELLDRDDPAALLKARQWDDWKDDNARGSGNRKNKG